MMGIESNIMAVIYLDIAKLSNDSFNLKVRVDPKHYLKAGPPRGGQMPSGLAISKLLIQIPHAI